jgi:hypothetical protein
MSTSFTTKRKVVHHRRALQDQRFRPFLKRQFWRFIYPIWPTLKNLYVSFDAYLGDEVRLSKMLVLTVLLFIAVYLFGRVPV